MTDKRDWKRWSWLIALSLTAPIALAIWYFGSTSLSVSLEEARIIDIAKRAMSANDDWIGRAQFEKPQRNADGSWTVLVWRKPAAPGGDRSIQIDAQGNVTEYGRGL
jgi:hypothetical protein